MSITTSPHTPTSPSSTDWKSYDFDLGIDGFRYSDLNRVRRLEELDRVFLADLERRDPVLFEHFQTYRAKLGEGVDSKEVSWILVETAKHLGRFVGKLFRVQDEHRDLETRIVSTGQIFVWKRRYLNVKVLKRAPKDIDSVDAKAAERDYDLIVRNAFQDHRTLDAEKSFALVGLDLLNLHEQIAGKFGKTPAGPPPESSITEAARIARALGDDAEAIAALGPFPTPDMDSDRAEVGRFVGELLEAVRRFGVCLAWHPEVRHRTANWTSFRKPKKIDYNNLVEVERTCAAHPEQLEGPRAHRRMRDGFVLTDHRLPPRESLAEVHYCLFCHDREKDSCSKGFTLDVKGKAPKPLPKAGTFKTNPLGIPLIGCPLEEHISEAHLAKSRGQTIGALAIVMVRNPLCPGTGTRICNDCMKGCIYQKQDPVNIPEVETRILTDVLELPYGVEIYQLLTRWNALNPKYPFPRTYNGKKVLVVGMGPAGYTLAHHLLQAGFGVVGIDGLKIEPLPQELVGARRRVPKPIKDFRREFWTELDDRILRGFGGVSEYGITVRWDKNFLDLIFLTLARRKKFKLYDGVRFGGTLTLDDAWALGVDHVAIATGAGKPTIVSMKNNLARGVRKASDFLMTLQLTGAFKKSSLVNLQLRLPAVVIGGGLTGIDTATEIIAYYPVQVEKVLERYERLKEVRGEQAIHERLSKEDREIMREQLAHGRAVRDERRKAWAERREPDLSRLVRDWGGVTLVYRKRLQDAPAYRLNHEEIEKAFEEGIHFCEQLTPDEVHTDEYGATASITFRKTSRGDDGRWTTTDATRTFPARAIMVAAGTSPNTIYEREFPGTFKMDKWNWYFQPHKRVRAGGKYTLVPCENGEVGFFTSYEQNGRFVTFYGDNHPNYQGNVVKAMASALHGFHQIADLFEDEVRQLVMDEQPDREWDWVIFSERLRDGLQTRVVDVIRLTPKIVEVIVRSPFAARNFEPGQFYRLQNYESFAPELEGYRLTTEGLALTGAWVDRERGLLSMIVLEMGTSSRLCAYLRPGERVVVMGPTGTPTEIPTNETVMLVGGGLGNAVLFSIAEACKANNNRVLYFAGYKDSADLFKKHAIEKATDVVIWCQDQGTPIEPRRPQDRGFAGNIVQAMQAYASGQLGAPPIRMCEVDRIITIGSDRMMRAVKTSRKTVLAEYLNPDHLAIGSINSPMNCMMKEICAQCLQRNVDPKTGKETFVFTCFNQDQELDVVDFDHLNTRLGVNSFAEKLSNMWLDYLIMKRDLAEGHGQS